MEFCESNLSHFLDSMKKAYDSSLIALYINSELFFEIVQGLNYLHTRKPAIIHRDLSPSNILLKKSGDGKNIKISDFGLSVEHEKKVIGCTSKSNSHTENIGNVIYMAPEVKLGKRYNEKSDIYSLGHILFKMFDLDFSGLVKKFLIKFLD
jgi:serine/threonine protein kinase